MQRAGRLIVWAWCCSAAMAAVTAEAETSAARAAAQPNAALSALGRALFFDVNLSWPRTQSCATCHDPERAYSDAGAAAANAGASPSADARFLGDRNAPSTTYAALVPGLSRGPDGVYVGGLFHDGRAADLVEQATGPMLSPIEMQMPNVAAVMARVRENPAYVAAFEQLFGNRVFATADSAFLALRLAIAAYERTPEFVAFDSRYDRFLKGELKLTDRELRGRDLFFSAVTNCMQCHVLNAQRVVEHEPFTSFKHFNIGVPTNLALRQRNGLGLAAVDRGLGATPAARGRAQDGRFRVPSLRNVAVTGPYMHNGVFTSLVGTVAFYNQYLGRNVRHATNPETQQPWGAPEVASGIELSRLRMGQPMDDERIALLVTFLRALTDRRYENLLDAPRSEP